MVGDADKTLSGIGLLQDLPEETIRDLEELCRWRACGEGEMIFDRTDATSDVYFIAKGSCRVVGHAKSGQQIAFVDLEAGRHCGELSAIDGQARSATLYALEDTLLASLPSDTFLTFVREHPKVAVRLIQSFVNLIRGLNERVVGLSSTTDAQRVFNEILQMAEPDPTNPSGWIVKYMPNHRELALWAGTTPETVAQAIGQLLESEVAKRKFKTLHILDRQRLQEFIVSS